MKAYIARRAFLAVPTLIGVSLFTFLIMAVIPGDIAYSILGKAATAEAIEAVREKLGLDDPWYVRYGRWMKDTLSLDLGHTGTSQAMMASNFHEPEPIRDLLVDRLPVTLNLTINAIVLSAVLGIFLGTVSAIKRNTWVDYIARIISVIGLSIPVFWLGIVILLILAVWWSWSPGFHYVTPFEDPWGNLKIMFWPSITLAFQLVAFTARMTRSALMEVLLEDYMRTARAKGLRERVVVVRHGLRNAIIPVVTLNSLNFVALLGGLVVTERVFNLAGWGSFLWTGVQLRDFHLVQTMVFVFAFIVIVVNLLTDILYAWLDPRIRYG